MATNVTFVRPDSDAWETAWAELAALALNHMCSDSPCCEHPDCHEVWQYMGTFGGMHEFRHRLHPITEQREIARLRATACEVVS